MVSLSIQQQNTRQIEIEFISHRSWRKYQAPPEEAHEEIKAKYRQERQPMVPYAFVRVHG